MKTKLNGVVRGIMRVIPIEFISVDADLLRRVERLESLAGQWPVIAKRQTDVIQVRTLAAIYAGVTVEQMCKKGRTEHLAWSRFVFWYLARRLTRCALSELGHLCSHEHHKCVWNGIRRVQERMANTPAFRLEIEALEADARARLANHPKL